MSERVEDEDGFGRARGFSRSALLDVCAALLALVGLCDAIYLTVEHLNGSTLQCSITHGCAEVLGSPYATVGGLPLAAFGAVAYFTAFSLATLGAFGYAAARRLLAIVVALMFLFSLWLFYLQAFVLRAFCQYCLLSASVTTLLLIVVLLQRFNARRG